MISSSRLLAAIEENENALDALLPDAGTRGMAKASLDALKDTDPLALRDAIEEIEAHQPIEVLDAMAPALRVAKRRVNASHFDSEGISSGA